MSIIKLICSRNSTIQKKVYECMLVLGFLDEKQNFFTFSYCSQVTVVCVVGKTPVIDIIFCVHAQVYTNVST